MRGILGQSEETGLRLVFAFSHDTLGCNKNVMLSTPLLTQLPVHWFSEMGLRGVET